MVIRTDRSLSQRIKRLHLQLDTLPREVLDVERGQSLISLRGRGSSVLHQPGDAVEVGG